MLDVGFSRNLRDFDGDEYDECEPWMSPGDLLKHFEVK